MTRAASEIIWNDQLIEQLDWHWRSLLRPRLDGLTDEEYLWEPVPDCWTVRRLDDGSTTADYALSEPDPPPFTTIAWRMTHIANPVLAMRVNHHFGDGTWRIDEADWPTTAGAGLAALDSAYEEWVAGVRSLGDDGLARPCGPSEGPYADHPFAALVLHINREVVHHGAEIACLRDLYRWQLGGGTA